ncbi:helix-turn-helix domain-containing protein, partial [Streptomyces sp. Agncl-13]|uniref:helix-turn-helix domain-containing protein n=1 Tax=Streptomyces sp. Agncl-13 TaxID=3400628 RepID=UPI003A85418E
MADEPNPLGEYVRARRELVTPEQAGIPAFGVRRVPGLRREEVAMLAGISADYYLRLEQGRDRNPSVQGRLDVLLARVPLPVALLGPRVVLTRGRRRPAPASGAFGLSLQVELLAREDD